ncbi:uncharacterized protein IWZ02DRAFT_486962 [Phyllosticta citriasiana]|uniref:uncharacterized protein n=1 Tax=Phyllosticta citriasiana TaxID=595635 RepID=UPI0030FD7AC6
MSSESHPISLERFAEAITELELPSLHGKAAELRNSIFHLRRSNVQLQPFADDGDSDCAEAIRENEQTIQSMESRVELLRLEVERRGMPWVEDPTVAQQKESANGTQQAGDADSTTENAGAPRDGTDGTVGGVGHSTEQSANTRQERQRQESSAGQQAEEEEEGLYL